MSSKEQDKFVKSYHVLRHVPGVWIARCSIMCIEKWGRVIVRRGIGVQNTKQSNSQGLEFSLHSCRIKDDLREISSTSLLYTDEQHKKKIEED
ncbi:hypothetical protein DPMN_168969 [Dreissena polymorpha]|uniref:Uncharacterized protein n=1 Tax=Dreissena polymorpha TaxID=45954 RepID=A0A9D4J059_DREPO|nr:hypothetical protein DPMN_168969 [Dreissena polymorpha]